MRDSTAVTVKAKKLTVTDLHSSKGYLVWETLTLQVWPFLWQLDRTTTDNESQVYIYAPFVFKNTCGMFF